MVASAGHIIEEVGNPRVKSITRMNEKKKKTLKKNKKSYIHICGTVESIGGCKSQG